MSRNPLKLDENEAHTSRPFKLYKESLNKDLLEYGIIFNIAMVLSGCCSTLEELYEESYS